MTEKTALVVDDTDANRIFFERLLTQAAYSVRSAATGKDALTCAESIEELPLAIVDLQIPDINGLELTVRLRRLHPRTCIVVATMHDELSLMESAFSKGCNVFLVKPHGFMELFKRLTTGGPQAFIEGGPLVIDQYGPRPFRMTSGIG